MNVSGKIKKMKLSPQTEKTLTAMLERMPEDKARTMLEKIEGKSENEIKVFLEQALKPAGKSEITAKMKNMSPKEKSEFVKREEMKKKMAGMKGKGRQKSKNFFKSLMRLFVYMNPDRTKVVFSVILSVIAACANLAAPWFLSTALNAIQNKTLSQTEIDFQRLLWVLVILLVLYVVNFAFSFLSGNIMTRVVQNVLYKMRTDISDKVMRVPLSYFDRNALGDVLSRVTNDVDTIGTSLQQSVTQIMSYIITIIGSIILMFIISPLLTIACLCTIPLSIISTKIIMKKSQKNLVKQMKSTGELNGVVEEAFSGMNVIKAFGYEEEMLKKFDEKNEEMYNSATKAQFLMSTMNPVSTVFTNIAYTMICIWGAFEVITGNLSLGGITALVQYQKQYSTPLAQITTVINSLQTAVAASERVFEFLDETEEVKSLDNQKLNNVKGNVKFSHLKFGYTPDKLLMKDVNIDVKAGQKVAIVGPTGAGKTTLINLLLRFYEINGGEILIDGVNVKNVTRAELRKCFGMVLQETWLYNGSIKDNLKYGNVNISEESLNKITEETQIDYFISTMSNGIDTVINEDGSNISQGQKQLITIARAMAADPPILILDEATSSVDTRTEVMIQKAMTKLMEGRTSFVIAHRLSTIKDSDQILVMKDGDIVENGTHDELLSQNGLYADLYNSQFDTPYAS